MAANVVVSSLSHVAPPPVLVPPFVLPPGPRVRPPRLLKGTKAANTNPQPSGPVPPNRVWVQGEWRLPVSRAAKNESQRLSTKLERAVQARSHGVNIYAYTHVRTKQVVYSLSRIMRNSKIMRQLVFHGKKTVPESLRRDVWLPYFSVHFPDTVWGRYSGLLAYKRLRELSMRRQFEGPEDLVMASQEDVNKMSRKIDPDALERVLEKDEEKKNKDRIIPSVGMLLRKDYRARKLMDQKATSVADLALVLRIREDEEKLDTNDKAIIEQRRLDRMKFDEGTSVRYQERMRRLKKTLIATEAKQAELAEMISKEGRTTGQMPPEHHALRRMAMGEDAYIKSRTEVVQAKSNNDNLLPFEARVAEVKRILEKAVDLEPAEDGEQLAGEDDLPKHGVLAREREPIFEGGDASPVKVLWANPQDSEYAEQWPLTVQHDELERRAFVRDWQGRAVENSVHVIANDRARALRESAYDLQQKRLQERDAQMEGYNQKLAHTRVTRALEFFKEGLAIELELQERLRRMAQAKEDGDMEEPTSKSEPAVLYAEHKTIRGTLLPRLQTLLDKISAVQIDTHLEPTQDTSEIPEYAEVHNYVDETLRQQLEAAVSNEPSLDSLRPVKEFKEFMEKLLRRPPPMKTLQQPEERTAVDDVTDQTQHQQGPSSRSSSANDNGHTFIPVASEADDPTTALEALYAHHPILKNAATRITTLSTANSARRLEIAQQTKSFFRDRNAACAETQKEITRLRDEKGSHFIPSDVARRLLWEVRSQGAKEHDEEMWTLKKAAVEDEMEILRVYRALMVRGGAGLLLDRPGAGYSPYSTGDGAGVETVREPSVREWIGETGRWVRGWFGR